MHLLHLPKLGYTMENGAITGWLVPEGSTFEVGAPLYEVETEKNVVQVEARLPGTVARVIAKNDDALEIGTLIAVIADPGEELSPDQIAEAIAADGPTEVEDEVDDTAQLDAPAEGPAALAAPANGRVRALPKVRAAADRLGVDLSTLTGTGPRGSLTVEDVERAASESQQATPGGDSGPRVTERRTLTGVRKAMAASVEKSWAEVPQFVQQFRVDLTAVDAYRQKKKDEGDRVGLTAVLLAAIAHAVVAVPEVNSTLSGGEHILYADVNVGVAVASDRGLVVPTVGGVQDAGVSEIDARARAVIADARAGSLPIDVIPTITLSNLGGYGVETGMPLVTIPQAAIVFVGDAVDTPVVVDGEVVIRPLLGLAIGYDHRIVDGATGGEFVKALRGILENPSQLDSAARAS